MYMRRTCHFRSVVDEDTQRPKTALESTPLNCEFRASNYRKCYHSDQSIDRISPALLLPGSSDSVLRESSAISLPCRDSKSADRCKKLSGTYRNSSANSIASKKDAEQRPVSRYLTKTDTSEPDEDSISIVDLEITDSLLNPGFYNDEHLCEITSFLYMGELLAPFYEGVLCRLGIKGIVDISNLKSNELPGRLSYRCPCSCSNEVLVYSVQGLSRAPTAIIQYLMLICGRSLQSAHDLVKNRQPDVQINIGFWNSLALLDSKIGIQARTNSSNWGTSSSHVTQHGWSKESNNSKP